MKLLPFWLVLLTHLSHFGTCAQELSIDTGNTQSLIASPDSISHITPDLDGGFIVCFSNRDISRLDSSLTTTLGSFNTGTYDPASYKAYGLSDSWSLANGSSIVVDSQAGVVVATDGVTYTTYDYFSGTVEESLSITGAILAEYTMPIGVLGTDEFIHWVITANLFIVKFNGAHTQQLIIGLAELADFVKE